MEKLLRATAFSLLAVTSTAIAAPKDLHPSARIANPSFNSSLKPALTQEDFQKYADQVVHSLNQPLHMGSLHRFIINAAELLDQDYQLSFDQKNAAVIQIVSIIIDETDTPYFPDFLSDPIFKALLPPLTEVLLMAESNVSSLPLIPGVPNSEDANKLADQLASSYGQSIALADIPKFIGILASQANRYQETGAEERLKFASEAYDAFLSRTDVPYLPDFLIDPIVNQLGQAILEDLISFSRLPQDGAMPNEVQNPLLEKGWLKTLFQENAPQLEALYTNQVSQWKNLLTAPKDVIDNYEKNIFPTQLEDKVGRFLSMNQYQYIPFIMEQELSDAGYQPMIDLLQIEQLSRAAGFFAPIDSFIASYLQEWETQIGQFLQAYSGKPLSQWDSLNAEQIQQLKALQQQILAQFQKQVPTFQQDLVQGLIAHPEIWQKTVYKSAEDAASAVIDQLQFEQRYWIQELPQFNEPPLTPDNWLKPQPAPKPDPSMMNAAEKAIAAAHLDLKNPNTVVQARQQIYAAYLNLDKNGGVFQPISTSTTSGLPQKSYTKPDNLKAWTAVSGNRFPTNDPAQNLTMNPIKSGLVKYGIYSIKPVNYGINYAIPQGWNYDGKSYHESDTPGILVSLANPSNVWTASKEGGSNIGLCTSVKTSGADGKSSLEYKLVQGSILQGVNANNAVVRFNLQGIIASFDQQLIETPTGSVLKYRISSGSQIVLLYGDPKAFNLSVTDADKGIVQTASAYTGPFNLAILPTNSQLNQMPGYQSSAEQLIDQHADVVVQHAISGINPSTSGYEYLFLTSDIQGNPSAGNPLILLRYHDQTNLCSDNIEQTPLFYAGLNGPMRAVAGGNIQFTLSAAPTELIPENFHFTPSADLDTIYNLAMTQMMALGPHGDYLTVYENGKRMQNMLSFLLFGTRYLQDKGMTAADISKAFQPLSDKIGTWLKYVDQAFPYDPVGGGMVALRGDFGSWDYNDHIIHNGYWLRTAADLMAWNEEFYPDGNKWFSQPTSQSPTHTYKDYFDFLARDIANLSPDDPNFVQTRHFDIYEGHTWLNGIIDLADGRNMESSSESYNGDLGAARWLEVTGREQEGLGMSILAALEAQSSQTYYQIADPAHSFYDGFGKDYTSVTNLWSDFTDYATFWGTEWDRRVGIQLIPVSPLMMHTFFSQAYLQRAAALIEANWDPKNFDSNTIQSLLPAIVAMVDPAKASVMVSDVIKANYFDEGLNPFTLITIIEMRGKRTNP